MIFSKKKSKILRFLVILKLFFLHEQIEQNEIRTLCSEPSLFSYAKLSTFVDIRPD